MPESTQQQPTQQTPQQQGQTPTAQPAATPATQLPTGVGTGAAATLTPGMMPSAMPTMMGGVGGMVPSAPGATASPPATGPGPSFASTDDQEGEDLYRAVAKLAPFSSMGAISMNNGDNLKISCYFVNKFAIDPENTIYFRYGTDIKNISITDSVTKFGTMASVDIVDNGGLMASIMQSQMSYYFVISILNITEDSSENNSDSGSKIEKGILYQPYIFDVDFIDAASSDETKGKMYRVHLMDIISATLKKVSYGNLLLQYTSFPNCTNFADVYRHFIEYAALVINLSHDKKYKIPQLLYLGGSINDNINTIIKDVILKDVTIDTPLYSLLDKFYNLASRELEVPEHFAAKAEVKGMVSTPLMLNDEWEDMEGFYRNYYKDHDSDIMTENITYEGTITVQALMLRRGLYLKHLQMPFQLAFGDKPHVYETINPKYSEGKIDESELEFNPMNGYTNSTIDSIIELPVNANTAGLAWKNLALMNDGSAGSTNALIYWNWIHEYYRNVYLNYENNFIKKKFNKEVKPPIEPHFNKLDKLNLVGGDRDTFAKINANTIRLRSNDPVKEALWHVGRAIKSYIFLNALYGFKIKGNIIRHPGEIIKINAAARGDMEADTPQSIPGGFNTIIAGYTLSYITQITHTFVGSRYEDIVYATKLCDIDEISKNDNVGRTTEKTAEGVPTNAANTQQTTANSTGNNNTSGTNPLQNSSAPQAANSTSASATPNASGTPATPQQ